METRTELAAAWRGRSGCEGALVRCRSRVLAGMGVRASDLVIGAMKSHTSGLVAGKGTLRRSAGESRMVAALTHSAVEDEMRTPAMNRQRSHSVEAAAAGYGRAW